MVSVIMVVEQDLTAAAASVDAIRALSADGTRDRAGTGRRRGHGVHAARSCERSGHRCGGIGRGSGGGPESGFAKSRRGEHLAFLAPGFLPEPGWIAGALGAFRRDARQALCASWVLDGDAIVFAGSAMAVTGDPMSSDAGRSVRESSADDKACLLPIVGRVRRGCARVRVHVDGFDESFDARSSPRPISGGGSGSMVSASCRRPDRACNVVRPRPRTQSVATGANVEALQVLFKNLGEDSLAVLGVATLLTGRRTGRLRGARRARRRACRRSSGVRAEIQAAASGPRFRGAAVVPVTRKPFPGPGPKFGNCSTSWASARVFGRRRRVAMVTPRRACGRKMAGPAIRAWRMAIALSREHDVQLATTVSAAELTDVPRDPGRATTGSASSRRGATCSSSRATSCTTTRGCETRRRCCVVDIYDPIHLEVLEQSREPTDWDRRATAAHHRRGAQRAARAGRPLPLREREAARLLARAAGRASGRSTRATYDDGENLERLISVVPFGARRRTAAPDAARDPGRGAGHRSRRQGRALGRRHLQLVRPADARPRDRQVAPARCPKCACSSWACSTRIPTCPTMRMALRDAAARRRSSVSRTSTCSSTRAGSTTTIGRTTCSTPTSASSTHLDHVETAFSFRTRILDYLWASLAGGRDRRATRSPSSSSCASSAGGAAGRRRRARGRAVHRCSPTTTSATRCRTNVGRLRTGVPLESRASQPVLDRVRTGRDVRPTSWTLVSR